MTTATRETGYHYTIRRFVLVVFLVFVATAVAISIIDLLFAPYDVRPGFLAQLHDVLRISIMLAGGGCIALLARRLRATGFTSASGRLTSVISFFLILATALLIFFGILSTLDVPLSDLLLGGGILSIVIGLVVSTLFGNIISGALVLTAFPFKVGDYVLVNNTIPGQIAEITTLYTVVLTTVGGQFVMPNSAITSGGVSIVVLPPDTHILKERLRLSVGDRIYTGYLGGGEGVITEITPFFVKVKLDSNREASIPTNALVGGAVQIGRVAQDAHGQLNLSIRVAWDAEKTIRALTAAASDTSLFKSPLQIRYASLDGYVVELSLECMVNAASVEEARSVLIKAAYSVSLVTGRPERPEEGRP